ncbi:2-amino-4-hydroxy-6-hydroxymethyldihydropteridine diphosphokinase [Oceanobacter sp. 4_MG-2023]|uniref:2-amino-4-hydroxy-6- hydroxymethyldihydropteridine diphosphokinase n=1 Tax=Oceanobacter sp. 4_MG-2023 TaxID=3062623 RepID=UPI0027339851|nr:2-amino-4-hydroxy-6-hydroxymethyldihydropteridine diphosphokinase [Oceanobacter sp. 4_MG-2023]MDP2549426.1 2-amino-4-hydroxy-6-hydroxymethyldihydropteridine diphosphokinase [Oceanobacter sp. 4_MG-2023]
MAFYLLGLGSNLDPDTHLPLARQALNQHFELLATSPALETAPVGDTFHYTFKNQLAVIRTSLTAIQVKDILLNIERTLGREAKSPARKLKDRTIDLDILAEADAAPQCLSQALDDSYYRLVQKTWQPLLSADNPSQSLVKV